MSSGGLEKLAGSQRSFPRALRLWTGGFAMLIALGLAVLASRPPSEGPHPFEVMNFAEDSAVRPETEPAAGLATVSSAAGIVLRPALEPNSRMANAGMTRSAAIEIPVAATGY